MGITKINRELGLVQEKRISLWKIVKIDIAMYITPRTTHYHCGT